MSATQHLLVRNAFAGLLSASPVLADGEIDANRDYALAEKVARKISVYRDDSQPERGAIYGAPIDWTTTLRVLIRARSVPGKTAEVAADELSAAVFERAMADQSLGGLLSDLAPGPISWDQDEAATNLAICTMTFVATHRTAGRVIT